MRMNSAPSFSTQNSSPISLIIFFFMVPSSSPVGSWIVNWFRSESIFPSRCMASCPWVSLMVNLAGNWKRLPSASPIFPPFRSSKS